MGAVEQREVLQVSQFVELLNETLEFAYAHVFIEGEISGFNVSRGKFVFFDLKEGDHTVGCFMMVFQLKVPLEDGMKVRVKATPKLTKWGRFSLTVREVELAGEGELRRAQQLLQAKLEKEGLFDEARKRPVPRYPRTIGVISSAQAAGYADFLEILNKRWGGVTVRLADVAVQGQKAPDEIVGAIEYFNQHPVDVVVAIRGGGSLEDLAAFSTEPVARAVAGSRNPIIVGVGHEVDTSLADLAADLRAATPTDAARLVVPDRREFLTTLGYLQSRMEHTLDRRVAEVHSRIEQRLGVLERFITRPKERIVQAWRQLMNELERIHERTAVTRERVGYMQQALLAGQRRELTAVHSTLSSLDRALHSLDPHAVLRRGYAVARAESGQAIRNAGSVAVGDAVVVQLAEGRLKTEVTRVEAGD